jgi:hypothetical protein
MSTRYAIPQGDGMVELPLGIMQLLRWDAISDEAARAGLKSWGIGDDAVLKAIESKGWS